MKCPHCSSTRTRCHGSGRDGLARRFRCLHCGKTFQDIYRHAGCKPGVKQHIENLLARGDTYQAITLKLGVSSRTIAAVVKQQS